MTSTRTPRHDAPDVERLEARAAELEELLDAIRAGGVDAVVAGSSGRVYTLASADLPYRTIVEEMKEGALTVSERGIVLYANPWLSRMVGRSAAELVGRPVADLLGPDLSDALLHAGRTGTRRRGHLRTRRGDVPVTTSAVRIDVEEVPVRCVIVSDRSEEERTLAELTERAEEGSRHTATLESRLGASDRALAVTEGGENAMLRASNDTDLAAEICRIAVEKGHYALAWAGVRRPDGSVGRLAAAGEIGYLDEIEVRWDVDRSAETPTGRAIRDVRAHFVDDVADDREVSPWRRSAAAHGLRSACSFPITVHGATYGSLSIYARQPGAFGPDARRLLGRLAGDLSFGLMRRREVEDLRDALANTVGALATAAELRDLYTAGHQRRVGEVSAAIARQLGLEADETRGIETAAAIHDIGKLVVPAEILAKPAPLDAAEFAVIRKHPQAGADIVANIPFPWPVGEMILQHHERMDGSGYPLGIGGEEILTGSRIIAVADVVEAMSSHRPYRPALGLDRALAEIESGAGRLYDRDVVAACLAICREPGLHFDPDSARSFGHFA